MRKKPVRKNILSPSRFPEIDGPENLKNLVSVLRSRSNGLPIGVKIAAGHIKEDPEFIFQSEYDFITIDSKDGATESSPKFFHDASSVPTVYALAHARKYMNDHGIS